MRGVQQFASLAIIRSPIHKMWDGRVNKEATEKRAGHGGTRIQMIHKFVTG
jgi:hypothetical protein